jgi:phenolic acid decarboxylase
MQGIENQVAIDSVKQYELVARNGNAIDTCVHAGLVAAAFVQAKDEGNYRIWRARQTEDCTKAGMPF